MDQVTKVRKYIKREQWKILIKECQSSGMTVTAWCKTNGICEQTYYRNLKLLREELCENFPVPIDVPEKPVTFKKLEVTSLLPNTQAAVIIRLPNAKTRVLVNRLFKQCFLHCRVFVRRYYCCRKYLHRLWLHDMRKSIDGLAAVVQQQFRWLMEGLEIEQKSVLLRKDKFGPFSEKNPK